MNLKKLLSGALIGAFVFGIPAGNVDAASFDDAKKIYDAKQKYDSAKDKYDSAKDKFDSAKDKFGNKNSDNQNPPELPKDSDGNPMPPPDRNNSDNGDRPEPPKDSNGNPLPPPDRNNSDNSDRPEPPSDSKDKFGDLKDKYDSAKKIADKVR